jgi:hypothetical protein
MVSLAVFTLLWRVLPHGWNMTPVLALALFAGTRLKQPALRFILPLAVMVLSDLLLGFHDTMFYVYGALLVVVLMGQGLGARGSLPAYAGMSVAGSLLFYLITNFGVWMSGSLYPLTGEGLISSYVMGLPFLWKTLAGDFFFVMLFFAAFRLLADSSQATTPAEASASN